VGKGEGFRGGGGKEGSLNWNLEKGLALDLDQKSLIALLAFGTPPGLVCKLDSRSGFPFMVRALFRCFVLR
jgi:hypothetical protein